MERDIREKKKKNLKRYLRIKNKIDSLEDRLFMIDTKLTAAKTPFYSDQPRGGQSSGIEDLVAEKIETQDRINQLCSLKKVVKMEIIQSIDKLEDYRHAEVLEKFFIEGLTLEEIARCLNYSVRQIKRFYIEGLDAVIVE